MERLVFSPIDSMVTLFPNHHRKDKVIEIPDSGEPIRGQGSKEQPEYYYDVVPNRQSLKGFETVSVHKDEYYRRNTDFMMWIQGRDEWVVVKYSNWMESEPYYEESYSGPYKIEDYQAAKILEAFKVTNDKLHLEKVAHTEPEELEKLAENK